MRVVSRDSIYICMHCKNSIDDDSWMYCKKSKCAFKPDKDVDYIKVRCPICGNITKIDHSEFDNDLPFCKECHRIIPVTDENIVAVSTFSKSENTKSS